MGAHEEAKLVAAGDPPELDEIQDWVGAVLDDYSGGARIDVILLCHELACNAEERRGGVREMRLQRRPDDVVRVEVDDSAPAPLATPGPVIDWSSLGMRLLLVDRISTEWGSRPCPGGTTVWADLRFGES